MKQTTSSVLASLVLAPLLALTAPAGASNMDPRATDCEMVFNLDSWSVFYKSAKGEGVITCDNGQRLNVALRVRGVGLTVGKSRTVDGKGEFSDVTDIQETLGTYVAVEAHAGVVESAEALALTKGPVSLALAGTGQGFDLGIAISRFKIKPKR